MENKTLFDEKVLEVLPLNCRLYRNVERSLGTSDNNNELKVVQSEFHQNNSMALMKGFYKSVTRMVKGN